MIVLDTHSWIWWAGESPKLSSVARQAIDQEDEVGVSAISLWETAMLVKRGRLELDRKALAWIRAALAKPHAVLLPLTLEICVHSTDLDLPGDPADRIIAATALSLDAALVTRDRRLASFPRLKTIW